MSEPTADRPIENWGSKIGVIMAVAGSAVGLGNFLRFPGQAAANGGGAFMIPYFVSFLIVGIPICWAEWTMGRRGGRFGFNSCPGIFSVLWRNPISKYFGALGLLIPIIIYMYYVYLECWCLAYCWHYATGSMDLGKNPAAYSQYFQNLTGITKDGSVFEGGIQPIFWFFAITFALNFILIYRGLNRGIETFCKIAMPLLIVAAMFVAYRVLTLPQQPLPIPWQVGLAGALPDDEWKKLHDQSLAEASTAEGLAESVSSSIKDYFDKTRVNALGYDGSVLVAPPAGFFATPQGIAVAMAELRAQTRGTEYRQWIEQTREKLDDATKQRLQQLERDQKRLKVGPGSPTIHSWFLGLFRSDPQADAKEQDESAAAAYKDKLADLLKERGEILAAASTTPMPSLEDQLKTVAGLDANGQFLALQQRAAALEVSELSRTVFNGLGYMWNPDFGEIFNPQVWLAAAGQIFFSLSVGFGIVLTYASYLRPNDDVVLSGLTASTMNEFCEVILGGLVAIPATFIFLGTSATLDIIDGSSLTLGFNALPAVFANMPGGQWLGAIWFGLLFLAGVTSSLSMLQPAIAFFEEGFGLRRRASVASLGLLTLSGSFVVLYFTNNAVALDTMDFWVGSLAIYVLATIQIILFAWVIGVDEGLEEAHRGSHMTIPRFFRPIFKYVTPLFLLVIFVMWLDQNLLDRVVALKNNIPSLMTMMYILGVLLFLALMINLAAEQWRLQHKGESEVQ